MWSNLFDLSLPATNLIIRAVVVYVSVILLLRIAGKRQMGQMSATEFVALLLISNAVQNSMNGGDNSVSGGLLLAFVLIAVSVLITELTFRSKHFRALFEGVPTLLIHKGKMIRKNMHKERLSESELRQLMRKQGIHHIHDVATGILESDGTLTLTRISDPPEPHLE